MKVCTLTLKEKSKLSNYNISIELDSPSNNVVLDSVVVRVRKQVHLDTL